MRRVCIIVLDSVGIGAMPDAAEFGDEGAHTLGNIHKLRPLALPNLYAMGLGNIEGSSLPSAENPTAAYGRMAAKTRAKDTTSGHWELMGLVMDEPFRTFPNGFPPEFLREWEKRCALPGSLGNKTASGTEIIKELGAEHIRTKKPIVYTSADSVFQVAAHEEVIPLTDLYRICEEALAMLSIPRQNLASQDFATPLGKGVTPPQNRYESGGSVITGEMAVGRVIARPFTGATSGTSTGAAANFRRTANRKDFATPPTGETVLDKLVAAGRKVLGIGKISDIFAGRGISYVRHTKTNEQGIDATIAALAAAKAAAETADAALIFTNLVDFDMLYGHRNDVEGYAKALEYFDSRLPEILDALRPDDILCITADHGCDPTTVSTDHSREYVPLLVYGKKISPADLRTRESFAGLGDAVLRYLTFTPCAPQFLEEK